MAERLGEARVVRGVVAVQRAEVLLGVGAQQRAVGMREEQAVDAECAEGQQRRRGRLWRWLLCRARLAEPRARGDEGGARLAIGGGQGREVGVRIALAAQERRGRRCGSERGER